VCRSSCLVRPLAPATTSGAIKPRSMRISIAHDRTLGRGRRQIIGAPRRCVFAEIAQKELRDGHPSCLVTRWGAPHQPDAVNFDDCRCNSDPALNQVDRVGAQRHNLRLVQPAVREHVHDQAVLLE
jgi:hypothetical protein